MLESGWYYKFAFASEMTIPLLDSVSIPCNADTHSCCNFNRHLTACCPGPAIHLFWGQTQGQGKY